jgi:hypothetical protein
MEILRTNKNPDENPNLPISLKSLLKKSAKPWKYNPFCEEQKQTLFFMIETHHLALGLRNL